MSDGFWYSNCVVSNEVVGDKSNAIDSKLADQYGTDYAQFSNEKLEAIQQVAKNSENGVSDTKVEQYIQALNGNIPGSTSYPSGFIALTDFIKDKHLAPIKQLYSALDNSAKKRKLSFYIAQLDASLTVIPPLNESGHFTSTAYASDGTAIDYNNVIEYMIKENLLMTNPQPKGERSSQNKNQIRHHPITFSIKEENNSHALLFIGKHFGYIADNSLDEILRHSIKNALFMASRKNNINQTVLEKLLDDRLSSYIDENVIGNAAIKALKVGYSNRYNVILNDKRWYKSDSSFNVMANLVLHGHGKKINELLNDNELNNQFKEQSKQLYELIYSTYKDKKRSSQETYVGSTFLALVENDIIPAAEQNDAVKNMVVQQIKKSGLMREELRPKLAACLV